jgi:hypothetical protein
VVVAGPEMLADILRRVDAGSATWWLAPAPAAGGRRRVHRRGRLLETRCVRARARRHVPVPRQPSPQQAAAAEVHTASGGGCGDLHGAVASSPSAAGPLSSA